MKTKIQIWDDGLKGGALALGWEYLGLSDGGTFVLLKRTFGGFDHNDIEHVEQASDITYVQCDNFGNALYRVNQ